MKKILAFFTAIALILTGYSAVQALTAGIEPPADFIKNLKTCTKSHFEQKGTSVERYDIKGKTPGGRCEIYMDTYTDFTNKDNYDMAMNFISGFGSTIAGDKFDKSKLLSQDELIKMSKDSTFSITCKLSQSEIDTLINAYNKHDNKNSEAVITNNSMSYSFDSTKMSSYDKQLLNYQMGGPCIQNRTKNANDNWITTLYVCEYSDTTCYVHYSKSKDGTSTSYSMSCTGELSKYGNLDNKMRDAIVGHVKSGMCEKI